MRVGWRLGFVLVLGVLPAGAQQKGVVFTRDGKTVALEAYGPNIVRVTLGTEAQPAAAGYGFTGKADGAGWSATGDAYQSSRLVVRVAPAEQSEAVRPHSMPLDALNRSLREPYFGGYSGGSGLDRGIAITTPDGRDVLRLNGWSMTPNKYGPPQENGSVLKAEGSRVSATFDSPADEHLYGLGQHQQGFLDLRNHQIECWHDYTHLGGQEGCVPFMVSSRGYGLVWDNGSKTTIDAGFNGQTVWSSAVGDRVSFFVIVGSPDEIYKGYRQLTGVTHLLPRGVYGYIQSKAIYATQEELLAAARGYRERGLRRM